MLPVSTLIWIVFFGVILFVGVKLAEWYTKKTIINVQGEITFENTVNLNKIFSQIKATAFVAWVVVSLTTIYLNPWIHQDPQTDVGSEIVLEEVRLIDLPTQEDIKESNAEALDEPERVIKESVEEEQKKSRVSYDAFLKKYSKE